MDCHHKAAQIFEDRREFIGREQFQFVVSHVLLVVRRNCQCNIRFRECKRSASSSNDFEQFFSKFWSLTTTQNSLIGI